MTEMPELTDEEYVVEVDKLEDTIAELEKALLGMHIDFIKRHSKSRKDYKKKMKVLFKNEPCLRKAKPAKHRGIESKEKTINEWQRLHPNGTIQQCCRDTGVRITTVAKWWIEAE